MGSCPDIVGHPRQETDFDGIIKKDVCCLVNSVFLDNGIDELAAYLREFVGSKIPKQVARV